MGEGWAGVGQRSVQLGDWRGCAKGVRDVDVEAPDRARASIEIELRESVFPAHEMLRCVLSSIRIDPRTKGHGGCPAEVVANVASVRNPQIRRSACRPPTKEQIMFVSGQRWRQLTRLRVDDRPQILGPVPLMVDAFPSGDPDVAIDSPNAIRSVGL